MILPCWNEREANEADMKFGNVPKSKWNVTLDKIRDKPYCKTVETYMEHLKDNCERGRGMLLYGTYRSGKSSIGAIILREVARHRCRPYFLEAFELVDGWFAKDHRYDMTRGCHLLVLDDMGMEAEDPAQSVRRSIIKQAIRFRLERERAIIITTNMSPKQLRETYGDKLMALLSEFLIPLQIDGMSWSKEVWNVPQCGTGA